MDDTAKTPESEITEAPADGIAKRGKAVPADGSEHMIASGSLAPDTEYDVAGVTFKTDSSGNFDPTNDEERAALKALGVTSTKE